MPTPTLFHIAEPAAWSSAQRSGVYTGSTRGASLADVGFVHCSFREQVERVANMLYADSQDELLVLELDPASLQAPVRVENLDGGDEQFPHVYGGLPVAAVVAVHRLVRQSAGWVVAED